MDCILYIIKNRSTLNYEYLKQNSVEKSTKLKDNLLTFKYFEEGSW